MIEISILIGYGLIGTGIICGVYRFIRGPEVLNRIIAFDYLCGCVIALIAIYSFQKRISEFLELILIFSLLGFATIISFIEIFFKREKKNG